MRYPAKLLFVYNADSGLFNTLADIGHKLFSPATYPCALCAITHGVLTERDGWRDFIASLGATCEFLHRDQFRERFPEIQEALPAIFRQYGDRLRLCADATAIGACQGLEDLQALILLGCLEKDAAADGDGATEHAQPTA
jgi:hypothetical protein